jgi:hypothetical protein
MPREERSFVTLYAAVNLERLPNYARSLLNSGNTWMTTTAAAITEFIDFTGLCRVSFFISQLFQTALTYDLWKLDPEAQKISFLILQKEQNKLFPATWTKAKANMYVQL